MTLGVFQGTAAVAAPGGTHGGRGRLSGASAPVTQPAEEPSVTTVLVPGLTGSELIDRRSGDLIWGTSRRVFFPKDLGYSNALPIVQGLLRSDRIEARGLLHELSFLGWKKPIYGPLIDALEKSGRRLGQIERPRPDRDLYLFAYDWRRDNFDAVKNLAGALARITAVRPDTSFDLVCQSNATRICRYLVKYGTRILDERPGPPNGLSTVERPPTVRQLVLVGVSNGGSLRQLRELDRGRRYVPGVGRFMAPETLATLRPLFEDLPWLSEDDVADLFLDSNGEPIDVDLYDVDAWRRYGWSWFDREVEERINDRDTQGLFGNAEQRRTYFAQQLERSQAMSAALRSDSEAFAPSLGYCLLVNSTRETPARAVLRRSGSGWQTIFGDDPEARQLDASVRERLLAPGDGHATMHSQLALSEQETAAIWRREKVAGGHFDTVVEVATHGALLNCLNGPDAERTASDRSR